MFSKGHRFIYFWKFTCYVSAMSTTIAPSLRESNRYVRASYFLLLGIPIGVVGLVAWGTYVKTSPTVDAKERIRGWESVIRELPATSFLILVCLACFALAVSGARHGAVSSAFRAIWVHGLALFFVLLVVVNGSAENIMTTRPSTVKWLLFPLQVGITLLVVFVSRQLAATKSRQ